MVRKALIVTLTGLWVAACSSDVPDGGVDVDVGRTVKGIHDEHVVTGPKPFGHKEGCFVFFACDSCGKIFLPASPSSFSWDEFNGGG